MVDIIDFPKNNINFKIIKNLTQLLEQKIKDNKNILFFYSKWYPINYIKNIKSENRIKSHFNKLERKLNKFKKEYDNFYSIDLDEIFANHGYLQIYDSRNWYIASCRFSEFGIEKIQ